MRCVISPRNALALACLIAACGGPQVPAHDGYRSPNPWEDPRELELDSTGDVDIDDTVSYPERRRARWYELELPEAGALEARLALVSLGRETLPKLHFEVLDSSYNVLMSSRNEEEDGQDAAPEPEETLELVDLKPGTYYVHVYTMERVGRGDYNLRLQFAPGRLTAESSFPEEVAFVPPLPIVPAFDDAPPPKRKRRVRRRRPPRKEKKEEPKAEGRTVRILNARAADGGTRITLSAGSQDGVQKGWKGNVATTSGKMLANGGFTIRQVHTRRSIAVVPLTVDAVLDAKRARIRPPE